MRRSATFRPFRSVYTPSQIKKEKTTRISYCSFRESWATSAQTSRYVGCRLKVPIQRSLLSQEVLEIRTKNIQASKSRTEAFVSTVGQHAHAALPPSTSPLYGTPNRGTPMPSTDLISLNPMGDQQLQLQLLEEGQNTYIQQRGQAIEAIEATINELGSM